MKKTNVSAFANSVKIGMAKHAPEILVGIGITGMWSTVVMASRVTPKAISLLEQEKKRQNQDLSEEEQIKKLKPVDVIKTTWKLYLPVVVTGFVSTACIIGANSVHARRNALLATAYKLSENAFTEYKEKVIETIGEKKEKAIKGEIHKDRLEKNPAKESSIIVTSNGTTRCYDHHSGRRFTSDMQEIKKAINEINSILLRDGYVSLNEFYDQLDLNGTDIGAKMGWNTNMCRLIELDYDTQLDDGVPCLVLDYIVPPKYDFDKFF